MQIKLLGCLQVETPAGWVEVSSSQLAALVAFLALADGPISRGDLAGRLWPWAEPRAARHNLSQAVYRLRRLCQDPTLEVTARSIALKDKRVDFLDFQALVANRDCRAVDLMRGPLLDGVCWDSPDFEAALQVWRRKYAAILLTLAGDLVRAGDYEAADRVAAVIKITAPEDARLEPVAALLERRDPAAHSPSDTSTSEPLEAQLGDGIFVGRGDELYVLEQMYDESLNDFARVVHITGPPGIGKTSLCLRFLKYVALRGGKTLLSRGYTTEHNLPFGVVAQLLRDPALQAAAAGLEDPWSDILKTMFPGALGNVKGGKWVPHDGGEVALYEALQNAITNIRPVVVFLDEAEWCDPASLGFLHFLIRSQKTGVMLLLATRSGSEVDAIRSFRFTRELSLSELTKQEFTALVARLVDRWSAAQPNVDALYARTGGNPLLTKAVLRASDAGDSSAASDLVGQVLRPRLSRLSQPAQALLAAFAVIGERASVDLLAVVSSLPLQVASSALNELVWAGFVVEKGEIFAPTHGLAGELLLSDLPAVAKRQMYARAAQGLRAEGKAPSAVLAVKYDIAGEPSNAFRHALEAANASLQLYAHREAEYFLKLAHSHAPNAEERSRILLRLSRIYLNTGRAGDAAEVLNTREVFSELELDFAAYRVVAQITNGREPTALLREGSQIVTKACDCGRYSLAGFLLSSMSRAAHDMGLRSEASTLSQELLRLTPMVDDHNEALHLQLRAAGILGLTESSHLALREIDQAAQAVEDPHVRMTAMVARGAIRVVAGRLSEGEADILEAASLAERYGLFGNAFIIYNNLACCYVEYGRYLEAETALNRAEELLGNSATNRLFLFDNRAVCAFEQDDYSKALLFANESRRLNRPLISQRAWFVSHGVAGLCHLAGGRLPDAAECERELRFCFEKYEYLISDASYVEIFLARMMAYRGRTSEAVSRLLDMAELYEHRDFFCYSRLQVEAFRLQAERLSSARRAEAKRLYERLVAGHGLPLARRLAENVPSVLEEIAGHQV